MFDIDVTQYINFIHITCSCSGLQFVATEMAQSCICKRSLCGIA